MQFRFRPVGQGLEFGAAALVLVQAGLHVRHLFLQVLVALFQRGALRILQAGVKAVLRTGEARPGKGAAQVLLVCGKALGPFFKAFMQCGDACRVLVPLPAGGFKAAHGLLEFRFGLVQERVSFRLGAVGFPVAEEGSPSGPKKGERGLKACYGIAAGVDLLPGIEALLLFDETAFLQLEAGCGHAFGQSLLCLKGLALLCQPLQERRKLFSALREMAQRGQFETHTVEVAFLLDEFAFPFGLEAAHFGKERGLLLFQLTKGLHGAFGFLAGLCLLFAELLQGFHPFFGLRKHRRSRVQAGLRLTAGRIECAEQGFLRQAGGRARRSGEGRFLLGKEVRKALELGASFGQQGGGVFPVALHAGKMRPAQGKAVAHGANLLLTVLELELLFLRHGDIALGIGVMRCAAQGAGLAVLKLEARFLETAYAFEERKGIRQFLPQGLKVVQPAGFGKDEAVLVPDALPQLFQLEARGGTAFFKGGALAGKFPHPAQPGVQRAQLFLLLPPLRGASAAEHLVPFGFKGGHAGFEAALFFG